jgi:hypothetical protein
MILWDSYQGTTSVVPQAPLKILSFRIGLKAR